MRKLSCDSCGAPIESPVCKYCRCEISFDKLNVLTNKDKWIEEFNTSIINKIMNCHTLTNEEDSIFYNLLKYGYITNDIILKDELFYYNITGKKIISINTFLEYIEILFETYLNTYNAGQIKGYNPIVLIRDAENSNGHENNCDGFAIDKSIFYLNKARMEELYNGNIYPLIIFFHELKHGYQSIDMSLGKIDTNLMIITKEKIIKELSDLYNNSKNYYTNDNYFNISFEIDAQIFAVETTKRICKHFNFNIPDDVFDKTRKHYGSNILDTNRIARIHGETKQLSVEEMFDEVIKNDPTILTKFPVFNIEYILENDIVRSKNTEELYKTMEQVNDQNIVNYLNYIIEKKKNREK